MSCPLTVARSVVFGAYEPARATVSLTRSRSTLGKRCKEEEGKEESDTDEHDRRPGVRPRWHLPQDEWRQALDDLRHGLWVVLEVFQTLEHAGARMSIRFSMIGMIGTPCSFAMPISCITYAELMLVVVMSTTNALLR